MQPTARGEVISARFAPFEKALVRAAAVVDGKPVSEFVHAKVVAAAYARVSEIVEEQDEDSKPAKLATGVR